MAVQLIEFPNLFPYQKEVLTDPRKYKVLCWGAQSGKTRFSLYVQAAYVLAVGGKNSCWITRDGDFARDEFRLAGNLIPQGFLLEKPNRSALIYRLKNGSTWRFYSGLAPDSFRGKSWGSVVFNEASYCDRTGWYDVIAPRLRDWVIFNFTPKGQRNWTFDLWRQAGNRSHRWFRSQVSSFANPTIAPEILEEWKYLFPDSSYRQEILAEFVSDFGRYFNPKPKCYTGKFEMFQSGARYSAGIDWAKTQDFSALVIRRIDTVPHRVVHFQRLQHMDYTAQIPVLAPNLKEYGNPACLADSSEAAANELMRAAGCRVRDFVYSKASKQHICDELRIEFEQATVVFPGRSSRVREFVKEGKLPAGTEVPHYGDKEARQVEFLDDEIEYFEPYIQGGSLQLGARGEHHDDVINALMLSGEAARTGASQAVHGGGGLIVGGRR